MAVVLYPELLEDPNALKNTPAATTALADKVLTWSGPPNKKNETVAELYLELLRDLESWRPYQLDRLGMFLGAGKVRGWGGYYQRLPTTSNPFQPLPDPAYHSRPLPTTSNHLQPLFPACSQWLVDPRDLPRRVQRHAIRHEGESQGNRRCEA